MAKSAVFVAGMLALGLLTACSQDEDPLPGRRIDIRAPIDGATAAAAPRSVAFSAPPMVQNANWTHRAGSAGKTPIHPALGPSPSLAWSVGIGEGDDRKHRITADPVVANGRIFTLDSRATVSAVSTQGQRLWSSNLTPASEQEGDASGGGLATDGARVYATTAFGRLFALDAATGAVLWQQRMGAAATSPPTVANGVVYAVGADSRAWAVDAQTGRVVWDVAGTPSISGVSGGAGPVVTDRLILLPSQSSEILGVLKLSGLRVWAAPVSGQRQGKAYARISDITGDPVVAGGTVYSGGAAGRTVALDLASGERIWTADEGAMGPVVVAGRSLFLISDQNELVRLDASSGDRIWGVQLPYFTSNRARRRREITAHYGPVLAGGRLYVASGDETLRVFDPASGGLVGSIPLPGGAASQPAVAGGTLYVVSSDGELLAFR
jgi:outer membrane protein assembly factor BamB